MTNAVLNRVKKEPADEYYTRLQDIHEEVVHYTRYFKNKVVYCPCDDPSWSNFWKYLVGNFGRLGLRGLMSTYYNAKGRSELTLFDGKTVKKYPLAGNGDFRSAECMALMRRADIICTNPPFSLGRAFMHAVAGSGRKFLYIGTFNMVTQDTIGHFVNDEIHCGYSTGLDFINPSGGPGHIGQSCWFTNLPVRKTHLTLTAAYSPKAFPECTSDVKNAPIKKAIFIGFYKDIPKNYPGIMGVPASFISKIDEKQFAIVGIMNPVVDGERKFKRLLIRRK